MRRRDGTARGRRLNFGQAYFQNTGAGKSSVKSYMAEGDEDYSPAFPNSVLMARELTDRVEKVGTIEALIGSFALQQGFDPSFGRRVH